jgi:serine/threonine protein kinase
MINQKLVSVSNVPISPHVRAGCTIRRRQRFKLRDFELLTLLGVGVSGKVFLVRNKTSGGVYAMKAMPKEQLVDQGTKDMMLLERNILAEIDHPFLTALRFAFQDEQHLYLVMDFVHGGELFYHLGIANKFPQEQVQFYAAEIYVAIAHLHSLNIVYRDLKPENLLLDRNGHIRVTDFGVAKANVKADENLLKSFVGSPEYLAPEILCYVAGKNTDGYGKAADWWALGTLVFEMLVGAPPFYQENRNLMYKAIMQDPVRFPDHVSEVAKDFISKLLVKEPTKRLGFGEHGSKDIMAHPFMQGIDWDKLVSLQVPPPMKPPVKHELDTQNFQISFTSQTPEISKRNIWHRNPHTDNDQDHTNYLFNFSYGHD